jgi:hypothetical protein
LKSNREIHQKTANKTTAAMIAATAMVFFHGMAVTSVVNRLRT